MGAEAAINGDFTPEKEQISDAVVNVVRKANPGETEEKVEKKSFETLAQILALLALCTKKST